MHIGVVVAYIYYMLGRFDDARALWRGAETMIAELGLERESAMFAGVIGSAETWTGDVETAERLLRHSYATTEEGARWTDAMTLADLLLDTGREDEAAALIRAAEDAAVESDIQVEMSRRYVRARLLARHGRFGEAETLAREAIGIGAGIDELNERARAECALGEVLARAGRRAEAEAAFDAAAALLGRKENVAGLAWLAELRERLELGAAVSPPGSAS
jgi:Flp pilus assembly protein TadD